MPELPEVETVRLGLQRWVAGRTVAEVEICHPRAIHRHPAGAEDLAERLSGATLTAACRRGKYLWLPLERSDRGPAGSDHGEQALVAHLGMSGQMLVASADAQPHAHLRARISFVDGRQQLRFVDQRMFGGIAVEPLVRSADEPAGVPRSVANIARDPLDPAFDDIAFCAALARRRTQVKRALLDQSLVSGIGNIYADEALWLARLHWAAPTQAMTRPATLRLLAAVRQVMDAALLAGGTSFDALYVDVNGRSGYFDRSLNAYGQAGRPCRRCATVILREAFMNRSSFRCPRCQPGPTGRSNEGLRPHQHTARRAEAERSR